MKVNNARDLNGYNGGNLKTGYYAVYAEYLVQTVKAWSNAGVPVWSVSIGNEVNHAASYPSFLLDPTDQAQIAAIVRARLAALGLGSTQIFAHEMNFVSEFVLAATVHLS